MITGPKVHFEARLVERGYSMNDVRACIVSEDGEEITVDETHPDYPRAFRQTSAGEPTTTDSPEPRKLPPLSERVGNFFKSAASHIAAGMPRATDEQIAARYAICQGCEFLAEGACSKCGCPVQRESKFISKLSWANEKCPVGKWGPVAQ